MAWWGIKLHTMNEIQLHHLFNHLAPIGILVGLIILIVGLVVKKNHVKVTAAWVILFCGITVLPASRTGEMAEEKSEHIEGVSRKAIHEHEEIAGVSFVLSLISSAIALTLIIANKKAPKWQNHIAILLLLMTLSSSIALALASHQGGFIRHPELNTSIENNYNTEEEEHD
jgi:uncharacterized membrane protein